MRFFTSLQLCKCLHSAFDFSVHSDLPWKSSIQPGGGGKKKKKDLVLLLISVLAFLRQKSEPLSKMVIPWISCPPGTLSLYQFEHRTSFAMCTLLGGIPNFLPNKNSLKIPVSSRPFLFLTHS